MVINIIDRDFNFLGQIDEYESFMPSKKWHSIGNFELHLHKNNPYASALVKENIIFTSETKAYVISYRELNSSDGKLIVKGLELKSYLARWLVFPPTGLAYYRVNSNAETIMKSYVTATLARKGVTNVAVAANQNRGTTTVYQSRYKNLAEELEKLSLASGLGWDVSLDLDNKKFVFDVVEGRNITVNQSALPPAIFSVDYDNVGEQQLTESRTNYANMAIVAGQGEGADRAIAIVGESVGLDCYEVFVDARDVESSGDLPYRGEQKLSETQEILTFDSEVLTNRNLIYGTDYKLGDVCTIQNHDWGVSVDRRITETVEIYESSGFRLDVVFGDAMPTILDIIKQSTDAPIVEGGSEGETGLPGQDGNDGVSIEYQWNGTELGIKREDEVGYQYQDLKGDKGDKGDTGEQGIQGIPGLDGKSLEFHWNNTQLGIRVEGQSTYQYINLKGEKGDQGIQGLKGDKGDKGNDGYTPVKGVDYFDGIDGIDGKDGEQGIQGEQGEQGIQGDTGAKGDKPNHRWVSQTQIQFENPDGTWGDAVDLDPQAVLIHQEHFNTTDGQEIFNLTKGAYRLGTNSINWHLDGIKQANDALEELSSTSVKIKGGVPEGSVIIEYLEFANIAIGLKGDKGDKGDTGEQGIQGIQGVAGQDGLTTSVNGVAHVNGAITLTQDNIPDGSTNKAFTATEKTKLEGIAANANNYVHPTTAGNKHIPTGGASGQILRYSASGTAVWGADSDTITTINGKTGAITKADITALGIPAQDTVVDISGKADTTYVDGKVKTDVPVGAKFTDTVYTHPASHPASMITDLPTTLPANGGNADTVGGFTVGVNVPANAKFTDTNTITTINGKTGAISKADIVALGIPAQDTNTVYSHPASHPASMITGLPTKLSEFQNDIGAGAGLNIVTSATEPNLNTGDQWHKEI